MRRCLSAAGLLAVLLLLPDGSRAAEAPYAGNWKVLIVPPGQELALYIVKVEASDSGPKVEVVATGIDQLKDPRIEGARVEGGALKFTAEVAGFTLLFDVYPPKGEKEPKRLLGSVSVRGNSDFVRFERTEDKKIDEKQAAKQTGGTQEFLKAASSTKDPKEKETALKELVEKYPESPLAYQCDLALLEVLPVNGAREEAIRATAEKAIQFAAAYGPGMKERAVSQAAQKLVASKKAPALAVEYARQAEKGLAKDATPAQQVSRLKTLVSALKQAEKNEEAKEVGERLAKLDKQLDAEFLKDAVPFKTEPFTRKGSGSRTVLVELFTGAQCPPCVAADVAFDAALRTYKPQDVVLLQYHLHIPGPDPLTNDDTEKRFEYYDGGGVPATIADGARKLPLGGPKEGGKGSFEQLTEAIKSQLDKESPAKIKLTATQSGETILIRAEVANLKDAGEDVKLRLALVEEVVRYPGRNGQRFHHHVVRAMPGGPEGLALKDKDKQEVKVNLADLRRSLADYLEKANKSRPFLDDERPLGLDHLMVVAFIQNDKTKEVLQAAQVEVQAGK